MGSSSSRHTKRHSYIFSWAPRFTQAGVLFLDLDVEFDLQSVPGSLLGLCLNVLCQVSQRHPHAVTAPSNRFTLLPIHINAHFSTLRRNLLSPELIQQTSPSRPLKYFVWVRSWGTERMWKADTTNPALPQELFTSDWEQRKILFLEMGKLFGKRKKLWQFSFPLETNLFAIEESWKLNWR